MIGEWWLANPAEDTANYEPPEASVRVPGALREISSGEFALETIGFIGKDPFQARRSDQLEKTDSQINIWGTDRSKKCFSLFNCLRTYTPRLSEHEDWKVGWHAQGNAWVTPDDMCDRVSIHTDDLHTWALHGRPTNVKVNDASGTAEIDLREESLGTATIGEISVSLVRGIQFNHQGPLDPAERKFPIDNTVCWRVDGPLTLQNVTGKWVNGLGWFSRFMTMRHSVTSGVHCSMAVSGNRPRQATLTIPNLPRSTDSPDEPTGTGLSPERYLMTLDTFAKHDIELMTVFCRYWSEVATGANYMTMALHLDSQDRILNQGTDGSLLNAIRSVEAQYAAANPCEKVWNVSAQKKINDAIKRAGDIGEQIGAAWPALGEAGVLRRDVAHGRSRPSSDFNLRCIGGAMSIQWLQRLHLLKKMGISHHLASSIISDNPRFLEQLNLLKTWSVEL